MVKKFRIPNEEIVRKFEESHHHFRKTLMPKTTRLLSDLAVIAAERAIEAAGID